MKLCALVLIGVLLAITTELGATTNAFCPQWVKADSALPPCPAKNAEILPDHFPASILTVSSWAPYSGYDPQLSAAVIGRVLKHSGTRKPLITVSMDEEQYSKTVASILRQASSESEANEWRRHIVRVNQNTFAWQQDLFQPFVDPIGRTVLRKAQGFDERISFPDLVQSIQACGVSMGEDLPRTRHSGKRGERYSGVQNVFEGGNLEALPGGACLIGDADGDERRIRSESKSFCPKAVVVPTDWLNVGHVDELIRVVRNPKKQAPCNFAIAVADPEAGLKALRDGAKREPRSEFFESKIPNLRDSSGNEMSQVIAGICQRARQNRKKIQPQESESEGAILENSGAWIRSLQFSVSAAIAQEQDLVQASEMSRRCDGVTNAEALRVLETDRQFMQYQQNIIKKMAKTKELIRDQIRRDIPSCQVDFIEFPVLFASTKGTRPSQGAIGLPKQHLESVFPNPINGISLESALLTSDPLNSVFRSEIRAALDRHGITVDFVNTYHYMNFSQGGNLHCITNTVRACRPTTK